MNEAKARDVDLEYAVRKLQGDVAVHRTIK